MFLDEAAMTSVEVSSMRHRYWWISVWFQKRWLNVRCPSCLLWSF